MLEQIKKLLAIRSGESQVLLLALGLSFANVASYIMFQAYTSAIFLSTFSVSFLPYLFILKGLFIVVLASSYSKLLNTKLQNHINFYLLVGFIPIVALCRVLIKIDENWLVFAITITLEATAFLQIILSANTIGEVFNARQAKRLLPLVAAGGSFGAIMSGLFLPAIIQMFGIDNILIVIILALLGQLYFTRSLKPFKAITISAQQPHPRYKKKTSSIAQFRELFKNPLSKTFIILAFLSFFVLTLIDFQFMTELKRQYSKAEIGAFLGRFYMISDSIALCLQIFVVNRILGKFGIRAILIVLPLLVTLGSIFIVGSGLFWAVVLTKLLDTIFRFTFSKVGEEVALTPLTNMIRKKVRTFSKGTISPLSTILASILLMALPAIFAEKVQYVSYFVIPLGLCWCLFAFKFKTIYLNQLHDVVGNRLNTFQGLSMGEVVDSNARTLLIKQLYEAKDHQSVSLILDMLLESKESSKTILPLLDNPDTKIRQAGLKALGKLKDRSVVEHLIPLLNQENEPEELAILIDVLNDLDGHQVFNDMLQLLNHPSPLLKSKAIIYLLSRDPSDLQVIGELSKMIESENPDYRIYAAKTIGSLELDTHEQTLIDLLQDRIIEVREAAIDAIGFVQTQNLLEVLIELLEWKDSRPNLMKALANFENKLVNYIIKKQLTLDPQLIVILGLIGTPQAAELLFQHAQFAPLAERNLALRAYSRALERSHQRDEKRLTLLLDQEIPSLYFYNWLAINLKPETPLQTFFSNEIERQKQKCIDNIFSIFRGLYERSTLQSIYFYYQAGGSNQANAIEFLDNILSKEIKPKILPLLEGVNSPAQLSDIGKLLSITYHSIDEAIIKHSDQWLKLCYAYLNQDSKDQTIKTIVEENAHMFSIVEKVLLLRQVQLFSLLGGEELTAIANLADEIEFEPQSTIFEAGDPGDFLYVVSEGEVHVTAQEKILATLETGAVFGEIALLDGAPRTASIVCGDQPVKLLYISSTDFQDMLEENSGISKAVIRQLANYTRDLMTQVRG